MSPTPGISVHIRGGYRLKQAQEAVFSVDTMIASAPTWRRTASGIKLAPDPRARLGQQRAAVPLRPTRSRGQIRYRTEHVDVVDVSNGEANDIRREGRNRARSSWRTMSCEQRSGNVPRASAPRCCGNIAQADGRCRHEIRLAIGVDEEDAHFASAECILFRSSVKGETDTDYNGSM